MESVGECVVYGVGSPYVYEVDEMLRRLSWTVRGYVANLAEAFHADGLGPVVDLVDLPADWPALPAVFALFTPGHRAGVEREARGLGFAVFPAVVDPTAVLATTVSVGEGTTINAGSVIGARTSLGRFVAVNRSASVGHDVIVDDYASLGPGCVLCGTTRVGAGAFVAAGATVVPGVDIGRNAVVGAGAVVIHPVPPNTVVVGNPAKVVKEGVMGYNGVSIDGNV